MTESAEAIDLGLEPPRIRRSWWGMVAVRLLGRHGAKIGLTWVATLIFLAVFAPLLANSHPVVWSVDGKVSSPMLDHFTAADTTLIVSLVLGLIVLAFRKKLKGATAWWTWVGLVCLTAVIAYLAIPTPEAVVHKQYRVATQEGKVDWAVYAPIRFSPADFQRDYFEIHNATPGLLSPSLAHPLGTTTDGLDLASCMIHASRIALSIGLIATGIALIIGIAVGGVMGYFSGIADLLGMRLVEIFAAIPQIFLLIMICAFYGRNIYLMMVIIGLTGWVGYALFIRAEFLKLRNMDYVQAARATGVSTAAVLFRHMLPNGVTPILVLASFGIASAILTESTLSFLGLGLPPQETSWGQLLSEANRTGPGAWWLLIFPGLAIFLTVLAYNLVGEALRDAIDPHTQRTSQL